jgi:hypothetical protein
MESQETMALRKAIENYITKNIPLVVKAQNYSKQILEYGLLDDSKTLPFQILPTNISDADGGLVCKLIVNIDNPIYGFFSAEITEELCIITCPGSYRESVITLSHEDFEKWLEELSGEMDPFYQLSSAAGEKQTGFCTLFINDLLESYKSIVSGSLNKIKDYINSEPRALIVSGEMKALAKNAQKDFSRALLLPQAWVVLKSEDDLPENGESLENYIDEQATEILFEKLNDFFKSESYFAAPLYLAQRICLQSGLDVRGYSQTEDSWVVGSISEDMGEFVLPIIDIEKFDIQVI